MRATCTASDAADARDDENGAVEAAWGRQVPCCILSGLSLWRCGPLLRRRRRIVVCA